MDLSDYLKLNSNVIVDLAGKYVPTEMTKEPTFEELAGLLMGIFTVRNGDEVGKRDQVHNVVAMAMAYSIWCGWLSQEKVNRGAYPPELVDRFRRLIADAFVIGQKYSKDQPWF
jgi:hypothetical protein